MKLRAIKSETGNRTRLLIGYKDMPEFIQHLREGITGKANEERPVYAEFDSEMFDRKTFYFSLKENDFGPFLLMRETYNGGPQAGRTCSILIGSEARQVVEAMDLVMSRAEQYLEKQLDDCIRHL